MPTVLALDCNTIRTEQIVKVVQQINPAVQIESFTQPDTLLSRLRWHRIDLVIADSQLSCVPITDFIKRLRKLTPGQEIPLLVLTPPGHPEHKRQILDAGATDLLTTPLDEIECSIRCKNLLSQRHQQQLIQERTLSLEQQIDNATREIRHREYETLLRLAKAGEYRDQETGHHVTRMAKYSRLIAEQLGLPVSECDTIERAAPMHDIGKIGIPDEILHKPGPLTHAQYRIMKNHTLIGYEILKDSSSRYIQMGAIIALNHHEKFNGTGYPNCLARHDIPLPARIVTVADTYDALTSERPYKNKWSVEDAVDYLNEHRGNHFCPEAVDAFNAQLHNIIKVQFIQEDTSHGHTSAHITA